MRIIDLGGERKEFDRPIIVAPNDRTVVCNGEIVFAGAEGGIRFNPGSIIGGRWPSDEPYVSKLSLRDLAITCDTGPCLELVGCGKETRIDSVDVTGKGGALIEEWDGGSITDLYAFKCKDYGIKINRMHAAEMSVTARQTIGGPGVIADKLRVVTGSIYSESNDGLGAVFTDCEEMDLMCHFENNNRAISGTTDWRSLGHRYMQVDLERCSRLNLRGFWGRQTGQWVADSATAREMNAGVAEWRAEQRLLTPRWAPFWRKEEHRPTVAIDGNRARVHYPAGAFNVTNHYRRSWQRWNLFGRSQAFPKNTMVTLGVSVDIPQAIVSELRELHDAGKPSGLGTIGFGGFAYRPTFEDKKYRTLHPWNGAEHVSAVSTTWTRQQSRCEPNYQPCVGIESWDNPAFDATYVFDLIVSKDHAQGARGSDD